MGINVPTYVVSVTPESIKKVAENPSIFAELLTTYSFRAETYIEEMTETQLLHLIKDKAVLDAWVTYVCSFNAEIINETVTAEHTKSLLPKTITFIGGDHHYYGNEITSGSLDVERIFPTYVTHTNDIAVATYFKYETYCKTPFIKAYKHERARSQKLLPKLIQLLEKSADQSLDNAFRRMVSDMIGVGSPREATKRALNAKNHEILQLIFSKLSHKVAIPELFIGGEYSVFSQLVAALPDVAAHTALFKIATPLMQDPDVKALLQSWVKTIPTLTFSKLDTSYSHISQLLRGITPVTTAPMSFPTNSTDTELQSKKNNNLIEEEDTPVTLYANNLTLTDMSKKNNQNQYIYYPDVLTENILPKPDTLFIIAEHNLALAMLYLEKCTNDQLNSIATGAKQHLLAAFIVRILNSNTPEAAKRLLEIITTMVGLNVSKRCTMETWKNILNKDKSKAIMEWFIMRMDKETAQANMTEENDLYAVLVAEELYWPAQVLAETSEKPIPPLNNKFIAWITAQTSKMSFTKNTDFDRPPLKLAFLRLAIKASEINTSIEKLFRFAEKDSSVAMKYTLLFTSDEIDNLIAKGHELYPRKFFEKLLIEFKHNTPLSFIQKASPEYKFDFTQFHDESTHFPVIFYIMKSITENNNPALMEALLPNLSDDDINFLCSSFFGGPIYKNDKYDDTIFLPQLRILCGPHMPLTGKLLFLDELIPFLIKTLPESQEALTLSLSTVCSMKKETKQPFIYQIEKEHHLLLQLINAKKTNLAKQFYSSCPDAFDPSQDKQTRNAVYILKAMDKSLPTASSVLKTSLIQYSEYSDGETLRNAVTKTPSSSSSIKN